MSEMFGLRVIVDSAIECGTLHVMAPRPAREDFATQHAYEVAADRWWRKQFWTVENIGE